MNGLEEVFETMGPGPVSPNRPKRPAVPMLDLYTEALKAHVTAEPPSVILECGSDLNPMPIEWLWKGYPVTQKP